MNKDKRCFIISPIGREGSETRKHVDDVIDCIIEPALEKFGITGLRADYMDEPGKITSQMIQAILEYDLCIAILTGQNPNVFYELAVAQSASRPIILLNLKGEEIPFDVKDYRVIEYDLEPKQIFNKTWVNKLISSIKKVLSENYEPPGLFKNSEISPSYKIVFYSPTLKGNPFFHEILDHIIEITSHGERKFEVIVRKAIGTIDYHKTNDHWQLLREYKDKGYKNTVIIMIPANPDSYKDILKLDPETKLNLITLDMEVGINDKKLKHCSFLKQVIVIDNHKGSELAAKAVVRYCNEKGLKDLNIIICEGEFHNRGGFFREAIQSLASECDIKVKFLNRPKKLKFSNPDTAKKHVSQILETKNNTIQNRTTFIFCANDNLAFGARIALESLPINLEGTANIKIISFDASDTIRTLLELDDKYFFSSVDQKYYEYAQKAVSTANDILDGKTFENKITYITPTIYSKSNSDYT